MQTKKSAKADLERKKNIFLQIGIIVSLTLVFLAFEWTTTNNIKIDLPNGMATIWEDEFLPPPPPPTPLPKNTNDFRIVKNDIDIVDEIHITVETDETDEIPDAPPPQIIIANADPEIDEIVPFVAVEEKPSFPGGNEALLKFIYDNIQYPEMAVSTGIEGTVHTEFIIEKDGSIGDVKLLKGIGGGCDEEVLRVLKKLPRWKPGKQCNKAVKVPFIVPIKFSLQK